ncbi:hypothetical protein CRG98_028956 [Punica granatum]|uniref:Uncharacterized protein n=1 Tax=Punica granatum TaxID=22663 RepID=A0A2I0J328_PUNGR|nr:hypothetical protein CRG98_028956 [Punica granatum]
MRSCVSAEVEDVEEEDKSSTGLFLHLSLMSRKRISNNKKEELKAQRGRVTTTRSSKEVKIEKDKYVKEEAKKDEEGRREKGVASQLVVSFF